MKNRPVEPDAQRYRAVAQFPDNKEGLILLGNTSVEVCEEYQDAFLDLYEDKKHDVIGIQLQKWEGHPDCGRWKAQRTLTVPGDIGTLHIKTRTVADTMPIATKPKPPGPTSAAG